jgi:hypothetical protein
MKILKKRRGWEEKKIGFKSGFVIKWLLEPPQRTILLSLYPRTTTRGTPTHSPTIYPITQKHPPTNPQHPIT